MVAKVFSLLTSSTGRKAQMALTGLLLCAFLVGHLGGNLLLFKGPEAFNHYAELLANNPVLPAVELGLAFVFLLHAACGVWVWAGSRGARPVPYEASAWAGGRTIGSMTMIYTGVLLAAFLFIHVKAFRFTDSGGDLYRHVTGTFRSGPVALFYAACMAALGLHLSHGFQSAFQTLGVDHPRYTPLIRLAGLGFSVALAAGFAAIPLWWACRGACP